MCPPARKTAVAVAPYGSDIPVAAEVPQRQRQEFRGAAAGSTAIEDPALAL